MVHFEKSFWINRPLHEVFAYLTDPARFAEWQGSAEMARWTSPGPPGVGSTIRVSAVVLGRRVETELVVTAWDPPRRYAFQSAGGPLAGVLDHHLAAQDGGTRVTVAGKFELGGALRLAGRWAARRIEREVEADAARLKVRLEAGP
jgi:carbon monoxide dehydrogenase subunit G